MHKFKFNKEKNKKNHKTFNIKICCANRPEFQV